MEDTKRQPAAHSGAPAPHTEAATTDASHSPSAKHDMPVTLPEQHPARGCSPKHSGEVKAAAAT